MTPPPHPRIHRLIPSSGPIIGGIEVTVLGSNFHPSLQLQCIFGDVVASSTQRWSDNTLVCILPPRATSGVVAVWFNGLQKEDDGTPPCLFTYTDESDRALMELALQVVGLKITGKLEDVKSVAMRIVGPANEDTPSGSNAPNVMQLSTDSISMGLRSALHRMGPWSGLEKRIIDLLSLLDVRIDTSSGITLAAAMEHTTSGGQTLLHFAAFLKYPTLVSFLIEHEADKDARDHNWYTALHFASLVGAQSCAAILLGAGADVEIVNVEGKTAQELASFDFADVQVDDSAADGESRWGDGEDSDDERIPKPVLSRCPSRRGVEVTPSPASEDDGDGHHHVQAEVGKEKGDKDVDKKRTPTFMRTIRRTLARIQPKDGIMPYMPHLALPQLLQLPGMPVVPWAALPQMPTVFPVYVPWPVSLRTSRGSDTDTDTNGPASPKRKVRSLLTPQEWRALLEDWLVQGPPAAMQTHDDEVPPVYTPRAEGEAGPSGAGSSMSMSERPIARPVGYDTGLVPDDREANAGLMLANHTSGRRGEAAAAAAAAAPPPPPPPPPIEAPRPELPRGHNGDVSICICALLWRSARLLAAYARILDDRVVPPISPSLLLFPAHLTHIRPRRHPGFITPSSRSAAWTPQQYASAMTYQCWILVLSAPSAW
ncbi:hypothetical protein BGW80DRAFT_1563029 [Lactifluus volemus]|nr:hypothetical protein BGW80DRAFT_1563029 [Lactifluus volemus]